MAANLPVACSLVSENKEFCSGGGKFLARKKQNMYTLKYASTVTSMWGNYTFCLFIFPKC